VTGGRALRLFDWFSGKGRKEIAPNRKAIRIDPKLAAVHFNRGIALHAQGETDEAIAEYREAIRIRPDYYEARCNLSNALADRGKLDESIAEIRRAIRIKPELAVLHYTLGVGLDENGQRDEAVAAYREAIRIRPDYAEAHYNLGNTLLDGGRADEAITAYREAIRIRPDYVRARTNFGIALGGLGMLDDAIAEFREALRLDPDDAGLHIHLGLHLEQQGRFRESLDELRRGHRLGSNQPGWPFPSAECVRQAERLVALEPRLHAVLRGLDSPRDAGEAIELASAAYRARRYGPAARLFAEAFRAELVLEADINSGHRYNAARAAALAGTARGEAPSNDEGEKSRWRMQAVAWLAGDVTGWTTVVDSFPPEWRASAAEVLARWKAEADLAGIRDEAALAMLPEDEQKACRALWIDVDRVLEKAQVP
jgi:Tfp pilus assembly protein PilF